MLEKISSVHSTYFCSKVFYFPLALILFFLNCPFKERISHKLCPYKTQKFHMYYL